MNDSSEKFNAYAISIDNLRKTFEKSSSDSKIQKLLDYVPMGTNYVIKPFNSNWSEKTKEFIFGDLTIKCHDGGYNRYFNSKLTLREHINQPYLNCLHRVIVHPWFLEHLEQIPMDELMILMLDYQRCMYDENKSQTQTYDYSIEIWKLKKLIDSSNLHVVELLETNTQGYATCEKNSGIYIAGTYEEMCKSTMSLREHIRMYQRDQDICNFNTVNYGIHYYVNLSQNQVDLLVKAAKEVSEIKLILFMSLDTSSDVNIIKISPKDMDYYNQNHSIKIKLTKDSHKKRSSCIIS
jgi:hypothetical protein